MGPSGRPWGRRGITMEHTRLKIAPAELYGIVLVSGVAVILAVIVAGLAFGP